MPTVPAGSVPAAGDRPMTGAAMLSVSEPVAWVKGPVPTELSVTLVVKVKLPLAAGVPLMVQSLLSCVPAGSAPEASVVEQV